MQVLTGATGVNIDRSHFSNVGRDQNNYNYYANHQVIVQNGQKRAKIQRGLQAELSQFTEIKRGDIYKHGNVCFSWQLCSNGKDDTEAAVYHAELNIIGPFGQKKYTVKTYHGQNGKKEWRRDFLRCSTDWHGDVPLFGYNTTSIPSLIFYGELVPIAHVEAQVGLVGWMYFDILRKALRCSKNEIWMDLTKGRFCHGPVGPKCLECLDHYNVSEIPSDIGFLKEDVVIRYFSGIKHDGGLLSALRYTSHFELLKEVPSIYYPHVISNTTKSIIAIDWNVRWWSLKSCLRFNGKTTDGLTRFLLTDHGRHIGLTSFDEADSWLSQALSVFHVHDIQFDQDLSNIKYIDLYFQLKGTLQKSKSKCQRRQLGDPIYLFLLPSPSPNICFYFWSHDLSGQDPLSPDMCNYFGLPITLSVILKYHQLSWPTETYRAFHGYQVEKGFDPTTTDLAQSLTLPIFEVVSPVNRFQEVDSKEVQEGSLLGTLRRRFTLNLLQRPKAQKSSQRQSQSPRHSRFTNVVQSIFKKIRKIHFGGSMHRNQPI